MPGWARVVTSVSRRRPGPTRSSIRHRRKDHGPATTGPAAAMPRCSGRGPGDRALTGTGRLQGQLGPRTQRVVYGELTAAELDAELPLMLWVDQAHLVMLAERQLISAAAAAGLLRCMDGLAAARFRPLLGRPAPRGLYLMYESYLIEELGAGIGGVLHSGRSRNDLKATITSLR